MGLQDDPFSYRVTKSGEVRIGRVVVAVRGAQAQRLIANLGASDESDKQLLARVTGNDKRGNERRG